MRVGYRLDVEYLRHEMQRQVISQSELARKAVNPATGKPLSRQMLSDILRGHRGASPATIRALAAALDVLPRKLLRDAVLAPHDATALDGAA